MRRLFSGFRNPKPVLTDSRPDQEFEQTKLDQSMLTAEADQSVKQKIFFKSLRSTCKEDYERMKNKDDFALVKALQKIQEYADNPKVSAKGRRLFHIINDLAIAIFQTSQNSEDTKCVGLVETNFYTIRVQHKRSPYQLVDAIPLILPRLRNAASRSLTYTGYITDLMNAIKLFEPFVAELHAAKRTYGSTQETALLPRDFYLSQERGMHSKESGIISIPSCRDNLKEREKEMQYALQQLEKLQTWLSTTNTDTTANARKLYDFFEEIFDTIVYYADVKKKLFCVRNILRDVNRIVEDYKGLLPDDYIATYFLTDTMRDTVGEIMKDVDNEDNENNTLDPAEKARRNKYFLKVLDMYFVQLNIFYCHIPQLLSDMMLARGEQVSYAPPDAKKFITTEYPLFKRDTVMCKQFYEQVGTNKNQVQFPPRYILTHYVQSIRNRHEFNGLDELIAKMPERPMEKYVDFSGFLTTVMKQKRFKVVDEAVFKYYKLIYSYRNYELTISNATQYEAYYDAIFGTPLNTNIPQQFTPIPVMEGSNTSLAVDESIKNDMKHLQQYLVHLSSKEQIQPLVNASIESMFQKIKNSLPEGVDLPDDVKNPIQFQEQLVDAITQSVCEIIRDYATFQPVVQDNSDPLPTIYAHLNPCTVYECACAFLDDLQVLADALLKQLNALFGDLSQFYTKAHTSVLEMLQQQNQDIQNTVRQNEVYMDHIGTRTTSDKGPHDDSPSSIVDNINMDNVIAEDHVNHVGDGSVETSVKGGRKTKGKHKKPLIRHRKQQRTGGGVSDSSVFINQQNEKQQDTAKALVGSIMQCEVVLRCQTFISCIFKTLFGSIPYESDESSPVPIQDAHAIFHNHFKTFFYSHVETYYAAESTLLKVTKPEGVAMTVSGSIQLDMCKAYLRFRPQVHIMMLTAPKVASEIRDIIKIFDKQYEQTLVKNDKQLSTENHIRLLFDFTSEQVVQSVQEDIKSIFDVPKHAMLCTRSSASDQKEEATYAAAVSKLGISHEGLRCDPPNGMGVSTEMTIPTESE